MNKRFDGALIYVLRIRDFERAKKVCELCIEAGLKDIEVTTSVDRFEELISYLAKTYPNTNIGCGSILNLDHAKRAYDAGSAFFISPHIDMNLMDWFKQKNLFYIPGGSTPSELQSIKREGFEYQKLFPASLYGPSGVKTIIGPMPELNLIVTGGVKRENAKEFLDHGAKAICCGSNLFSNQYLEEKNWDMVKQEMQSWLGLLR